MWCDCVCHDGLGKWHCLQAGAQPFRTGRGSILHDCKGTSGCSMLWHVAVEMQVLFVDKEGIPEPAASTPECGRMSIGPTGVALSRSQFCQITGVTHS